MAGALPAAVASAAARSQGGRADARPGQVSAWPVMTSPLLWPTLVPLVRGRLSRLARRKLALSAGAGALNSHAHRRAWGRGIRVSVGATKSVSC